MNQLLSGFLTFFRMKLNSKYIIFLNSWTKSIFIICFWNYKIFIFDIKCIILYLEIQNTILSSLQINTAKGILDTILSVQPKESSGGKPGETREAIVYKIAEDMLRKLPRDYVPHEIKEALIRLGGLLPMNIFLRQEIDRMQKILSIGKHTYCNLIWLQ